MSAGKDEWTSRKGHKETEGLSCVKLEGFFGGGWICSIRFLPFSFAAFAWGRLLFWNQPPNPCHFSPPIFRLIFLPLFCSTAPVATPHTHKNKTGSGTRSSSNQNCAPKPVIARARETRAAGITYSRSSYPRIPSIWSPSRPPSAARNHTSRACSPPRNFSGNGRSDFVSKRSSETFTESSPVLVLNITLR